MLQCFIFLVLFLSLIPGNLRAQDPSNRLTVKAIPYPGRDPVMWNGVYAASSGKVYSGLITEGASAHFYQYDPEQDENILLFDFAEVVGSRGKGIRTPGKIHNKPVEDRVGNIYFVPMNNGCRKNMVYCGRFSVPYRQSKYTCTTMSPKTCRLSSQITLIFTPLFIK